MTPRLRPERVEPLGVPMVGELCQTIAATKTSTGLSVHAELDQASYPVGVKIPDQQMKTLDTDGILTRHDFHGEWNYSLHPTRRLNDLN